LCSTFKKGRTCWCFITWKGKFGKWWSCCYYFSSRNWFNCGL